ncbi:MAG: PolC-type DNA polymerase III [Lachnospiraceae bacterium]|nr:PolC-type DNA polymerase III [Lachnospiraceae bacterium]
METLIKSFKDAFPKLSLENDLDELTDIIDVERISLNSDKDVVTIYISSHQWLHRKNLLRLEQAIKTQLFKGYKIAIMIKERFILSSQYTPKHFYDSYKNSMMFELSEKSPILSHLFKRAEIKFSDGQITVIVPDMGIYKEKENELTEYLEFVFNKRCSFNIRIFLKINAELNDTLFETDKTNDEFEERLKSITTGIEKKETEKTQKKKNDKKYNKEEYRSEDPDIIYGHDVKEDSIPISEIEEGIGEAVIRGQILSTDSRELKSGKILFMFAITDLTDTIMAKMFLHPEKFEELSKSLSKGKFIKLKGKISMDTFSNELTFSYVTGIRLTAPFGEIRKDKADKKRIELHCHTKMSDMDGVTDAADLVKRAYEWGQPAIAITDHGVVQSFPEANKALGKIDDKFREKYKEAHPDIDKKELKKISSPFKVIYGCEIYLVDDKKSMVQSPKGQTLDASYVVFDLETTGFSPEHSAIIEIGAVRVEGQKITDRFSTFVNPKVPIPLRIEQLTKINDSMVVGARTIDEILPEFIKFCEGAVLVAHNASFDYSFIKKNCENLGIDIDFTVLDTVSLSRYMLPRLTRFKLDTVAKHLGVSLENHHRAVDDAECTAHIFLKLCKMLTEQGIGDLDALNEKGVLSKEAVRHLPTNHAVVLVKNETGRVNLYRLISESHLNYYYRRPRIPKTVFEKYRDGLIIGTACAAGELYQGIIRGMSDEALASIVDFYDYLEVQPLGNSSYLIADEGADGISTMEDLIKVNKKIISLGEEFNKPVVATGDVHFMDPGDSVYRSIIMDGQGFSDADDQAPLYLRTTGEMLDEFSYLDEKKAQELVVDNPQKIADMCEKISPIRAGKFPPVIENSDSDLRRICYEEAHRIYGEDLPEPVVSRLERELNSIISNGYAVMYIIAQKLVWKSNEDGYLVGSRGSVGSSFVATMAGITEVNPLSAHYLCPNCHYVDFDSDEVKAYSGRCGCDMPDKVCPKCGTQLNKMGFDIPFETFLGFEGNKEPDIDLNFSGEYQSNAHKYTEVIFGKGQTFKAGTIGTLADKTAYGFVKKYYENRGVHKRNCEIERIVGKCTGIRRTTGQHPGGIIVLPHGEDINSFTPVQHPANDVNSDIITTHFDYHSIDSNLLKLDILGHDDPTMIRMLEDLTGTNAKEVPLDEPKVMSLFKSTEALGIKPASIGGCKLGCLGIPEFGTDFVMQMLLDTKPSSFSDLIRISGLSHGTDVWLGNAKELITQGKATIATAICTRDDIMIYLIGKGVESEQSFKIMEAVRKGKGLTPQWEQIMKEHDVPDWYIWSCKTIKYMFPKAHAAAYVMMAYRIAWYKIYYPLAYYAAYFSIRASAINYDIMCRGQERLLQFIADYTERSNELSKKEQDTLKDMKIVREMYARGYDFVPVDIYEADAHRFKIKDGRLMPSLDSIDGLGDKAADAVVAAAAEGKFISQEDFRNRTKVSKSVVEYLVQVGILNELPESNQFSLFEMNF